MKVKLRLEDYILKFVKTTKSKLNKTLQKEAF